LAGIKAVRLWLGSTILLDVTVVLLTCVTVAFKVAFRGLMVVVATETGIIGIGAIVAGETVRS